jgi:hypothetical protein
MTLENLGPLMDELCAVLYGKGCTVREVAVTYAPLAPEDALDRRAERVMRRRDVRRAAAIGRLGYAARALARFQYPREQRSNAHVSQHQSHR